MKIAVVGAGIGGLTAAVALARENVDCVVYERHPALPDDGAGIQISANAAAELHELGLGAALDTAARPRRREIRRWRDNSVIGRIELESHHTLRRGALVAALHAAAGAGTVLFGKRCVAVRDEGSGVALGFDDGTTARADAVVGADGLRSSIRGLIVRDRLRYSGFTATRAILPADAAGPLVGPDEVVVWLGPDRHCVAYPVDGGRRLNLVTVAPEDGLAGWLPSMFGASPPASGRDGLAGWHPAVRVLAGLGGEVDRRRLYDRPPAPRWSRGRVVLLGDAAHPMLPFLAQGAAQAIEDAATLARCVRRPDPFTRYEALRRERVERVVEASRAGLRSHHLPDGEEQRRRDRAMAASPGGALDWLYRRLPAAQQGHQLDA